MRHGARAKAYERPLAWMPLVEPFTQENQQMTPKLSLRRNNIMKVYESLIESMYNTHAGHRIHYKRSDFR